MPRRNLILLTRQLRQEELVNFTWVSQLLNSLSTSLDSSSLCLCSISSYLSTSQQTLRHLYYYHKTSCYILNFLNAQRKNDLVIFKKDLQRFPPLRKQELLYFSVLLHWQECFMSKIYIMAALHKVSSSFVIGKNNKINRQK